MEVLPVNENDRIRKTLLLLYFSYQFYTKNRVFSYSNTTLVFAYILLVVICNSDGSIVDS